MRALGPNRAHHPRQVGKVMHRRDLGPAPRSEQLAHRLLLRAVDLTQEDSRACHVAAHVAAEAPQDPRARLPAAKERKMITDWANQPHVQEGVTRCCVGSAIVVTSAMARGALTAILWVWRPPVHLEVVPDVLSGIRYLSDTARQASLILPATPEQLYRNLQPELEHAGALSA